MLTVHEMAAVATLGSPDFVVVPFAERYAALAERLSLDFSSILYLLGHIPLCLRGAEHAAQRSDIALLMAERRTTLTAALPGLVAHYLAPLSRSGTADALGAVAVPLIAAVIDVMIDTPTGLAPDTIVLRVFSQSAGVSQRRKLESELATLRATLKRHHPHDSPQRTGSRMALAILGRDAMIGTLANSLHHHAMALGGRAFATAALDPVPSHTGVPYIDRISLESGTLDGASLAPGTTVRCQLHELEEEDATRRMRFFGAGAHTCLGRGVTLDLFAQVSATLRGFGTTPTVTAFVMRRDDVFACPATFTVRIET